MNLGVIPALILFLVSFMAGCGGEQSGTFWQWPPNDPVPSESVELSWERPVTNEDGSALNDLAGYRVYFRTETSRNYIKVADVIGYTRCSLSDLPKGERIYFAVTAYDTSGNESSFSNEVSAILSEV